MSITDGLAGRTTTTEQPSAGTARQAQDAATRTPVTRRGRPSPPASLAAGEGPQTLREASSPFPSPRGASTSPRAALSGAEWRAAAKAAQSKGRRGRTAQPAVAKPAAQAAIPAPVTAGAALTATATCLGHCDWTAGPGDPAEVDKLAERHTTKPPKHATNTVSVAAEIGGAA